MNPHAATRFTKCPRCAAKTNVRKIPLVIHVEGFGLLLLGKTCRLCLTCDMLVADKADLDQLVKSVAGVAEPAYLVLGTLARQVYRRGLAGGVSLEEVKAEMADFKSYYKVDVTPRGWYRKPQTRG